MTPPNEIASPATPVPSASSRRDGETASGGSGREALSARDREVLEAVVATYIFNAEPVSSRLVVKQGGLGLSSATIRNVMADLEDDGYLAQPHTSAGRIPTSRGYHLFIESLMRQRRVPARERRLIDENLARPPARPERLMEVASELLTELSQQVGMVITPRLGEAELRSVHFVRMSGRKVLCVVVSNAGFVDHKVIETDKPLSREKLLEISNYCNENFGGLTLRQVRERLIASMAEERAQMDRLLGLAIELAQRGLGEPPTPSLVVGGTSSLLSQPELGDIERVRRVFEAFTEKARLVEMLNRCMSGGGVRVVIGDDSDLTSELDFSLVATSYGFAGEPLGALGVFGPSRMEYQRLIPLVDYVGATLSRALAGRRQT